MHFVDIRLKFKDDQIIDVRNLINLFGHIDRRRLYEWQKKGYIKKIANNYYIFSDANAIVHGSFRFSEDLDFDNLGLTQSDFKEISQAIRYQLELDGYTILIKNVFKGAFHCYIRFLGLLFQSNLSGHKKEKVLIQLDAEPQGYKYTPDKYLLNKFGLFRYINVTPIDLLLAQKICAIFTRKREKGRDFFDGNSSALLNPPF